MCNAAARRLCRTTRILIPARAQAELFPSAPHQQTGRPARLGAPTMAGAIPHVSSATMSRQTSAPMPLGLSDTSALHQRGDNGQPGSSCPAVPLPTQHRDRRRAPHQAGAIPRALRTGGSSARCAPSPFAGVPRGSGCGFTYFEVLLSIFIGLGQIHPPPPRAARGKADQHRPLSFPAHPNTSARGNGAPRQEKGSSSIPQRLQAGESRACLGGVLLGPSSEIRLAWHTPRTTRTVPPVTRYS